MSATPVQIAPEWWMAYAEGVPYYHNTTTKETTWTAPMLSNEASTAGNSTNATENLKQADSQQANTMAAQNLTGGTMQGNDQGMQMMMSAAPPSAPRDITTSGSGYIPSPWMRFEDVKIDKALLEPMIRAGFATPTAIQSYTWPIGVEGRDMVGVAKTGSGKTLGFLLPAFAKILSERMRGGPVMLVLAPTRELAVQIDQDAKKFLSPAGVTTALAYGGAPKRDQLQTLRSKPQLLTATPGRLNDFIEMDAINMSDCKFATLDEADRMLDMGFEPQIRKILAKLPRRRQTFMFTATWPKEVRSLATDFMYDPIEVRVGDADSLKANEDIEQKVEICRDVRDKEDRLVKWIRQCQEQVIVFVATKRGCEQIARTVERSGAKTESIHGDRDQQARDRALASFKGGQVKVLVATDVAARGLDVKTVRLVVNFDPANNAEDYVHRIGRTGRAGMSGVAVSMLLRSEGRKAGQVAEVMKKSNKPVPPELEEIAQYGKGDGKSRYNSGGKGGKGGKGGGRDDDRGGGGGYGGGGGGRGRSRSRSRGRRDSGGGGGGGYDRGGGGGGGYDRGGGGGGGGGYGGGAEIQGSYGQPAPAAYGGQPAPAAYGQPAPAGYGMQPGMMPMNGGQPMMPGGYQQQPMPGYGGGYPQ